MKKDKLSANIMINRVLFVNYYRLPIYKWRKKSKALKQIQKVTKRWRRRETIPEIENFMCQYTEKKD